MHPKFVRMNTQQNHPVCINHPQHFAKNNLGVSVGTHHETNRRKHVEFQNARSPPVCSIRVGGILSYIDFVAHVECTTGWPYGLVFLTLGGNIFPQTVY